MATVVRNKLFGERKGVVDKAVGFNVGDLHVILGSDDDKKFGQITIRF